MADHNVGASVVVTDAKQEAELRNKLAQQQLADHLPDQRVFFVLKGLRMTVPYTLKVVCEPKESESFKAAAEKVLEKAFVETDSFLNNYNPKSEISKINDSKDTMGGFSLSTPLRTVLECVVEVSRSSGGSFDPATYPAAQFLRANRNRPLSPEQEASLVAITRYSNWLAGFSLEKGILTKKSPEARLDLGGVSKGYTVDRVIQLLAEAGMRNIFFDWGGDCKAMGRNPAGQPWAVGIVRPPTLAELSTPLAANHEPQMIKVVTLDNEATATSGDYENLIRDAHPSTTTYDPRANDLVVPDDIHVSSITVKSTSCMFADALATACFVKREIPRIRFFLDNWRFTKFPCVDYVAYSRKGEVMARMHEIAKESDDMRKQRMSTALPSRVVVVGGGLAGLSAAMEAAHCGANVVVLEKWSKLGGNSAKATSGINGWGTRPQGEKGIADNGKYFERDTYLSGKGGNCDASLVKMLSVKSSEAIHWLTRQFGIPLSVVSQLGGHSRPRTHRAPDLKDGTPVPIGYTIMKHMEEAVRKNNRITVLTDIEVLELISHNVTQPDQTHRTFVTGVVYKSRTEEDAQPIKLNADAVILATGGFSADRTENSLLREYAPKLSSRPTTNGPFATGDGIKMARKIGVQLVDMDKVQLHPTGFIDPTKPADPTKFLGPEALRGSGGILLNPRGERFVNELDLRSTVSKAIMSEGDVYPDSNGAFFAYCVLNEAARTLFGPNALGFYWKRQGLFKYAADVEELASILGCPVPALVDTLTAYEKVSTAKTYCALTGKSVFPCVIGTKGPFYVSVITPTIHYTMGGALITPSAEILSVHKSTGVFGGRRPVHGLFGAGEVTGGVHGMNRLGGNSLLECVVYGRIAGDRAATILQKSRTALSFTSWSTVVIREIREGGQFGHGTKIIRFNLPGALQAAGLKLGQFIAIRGEWDGQQLVGYYSPITLPDDLGVIGILVRADKGTLKDWVGALRPGDAVEMKAFGGLVIDRSPKQAKLFYRGAPIHQIAMIAGGTGVAPMIQLIRASLKVPYVDSITSLRLIYAAEEVEELSYREILATYERVSRKKFACRFVLNNPPPGWTEGVGFIDQNVLSTHVQRPAMDLLIVICGPPVMQRVVKSTLIAMGHNPHCVKTVDETTPALTKSKF